VRPDRVQPNVTSPPGSHFGLSRLHDGCPVVRAHRRVKAWETGDIRGAGTTCGSSKLSLVCASLQSVGLTTQVDNEHIRPKQA